MSAVDAAGIKVEYAGQDALDEYGALRFQPPQPIDKHYPGLHDQQSHGNWAWDAFRTMPGVAGVNVDLIREVDPKKADAVDAEMRAIFGGNGYDYPTERYKSLLLDAAKRSEEERIAFRDWYFRAHTEIEEMTATYRVDGDKLHGIMAAISPRMEWTYADGTPGPNRVVGEAIASIMRDGVKVETGEQLIREVKKRIGIAPQPAGKDPYRKAVRIMNGETISDVLGGIKVRSFYNNLLAMPGDRNVTIDSHMIRQALGDLVPSGYDVPKHMLDRPSRTRKPFGTDSLGILPGLGKIITDLTNDPDVKAAWGDLLPRQAQSIIWSERKSDDLD